MLTADDHIAIRYLVHRYADAVVHRNVTDWGNCWADDATWDLGGGRLVESKDAITSLWLKALGNFAATVQCVTNNDVQPGPKNGTATGRCYITEWFQKADGERGILLAHYDDAYVRVGSDWKFSRRFLQRHYQGAPDLSDPFLSTRPLLDERGLHTDV